MIDVSKSLKDAWDTFCGIDPTQQRLLLGMFTVLIGLCVLIVPNVLDTIGVNIQDWKRCFFSFCGAFFVSVGINWGFLDNALLTAPADDTNNDKGKNDQKDEVP